MYYLCIMKICINCNKQIIGRGTKYCSIRCKNHYFYTNKRNSFTKATGFSYQSFKGLNRKLEIVKSRGGGCNKCGYNKNLSALELHHIIPKDKSYLLDMRNLSNLSDIAISNELIKCELLCSNCHVELHNPLLDINYLKVKLLLLIS